MDSRIGYEVDFHAWLQEQAGLLRGAASQGLNLPLDFENLAEEIESVGRREWQELHGYIRRIIFGLLRFQWVPTAGEDREFRPSIMRERFDALLLLEYSPSLREKIDLAPFYERIRHYAIHDLATDGVTEADLPISSPYALDQILDADWWPVNRHGLS